MTGSRTLCVLIYNDVNGDSLRQEEVSFQEGQSASATGVISQTEDNPSGRDRFVLAI
jgi:hypothetical protein